MSDFVFHLDLDGVLADFESGIQAMGFPHDPELNKSTVLLSGTGNAKKRERYEAIKGTTFFADLPLLPGALDIYAEVAKHGEPIILTAAPKFGAGDDDCHLNPYWQGAAYHKRWWVEHVLLPRTRWHSAKFGKLFIKHMSMANTRVRIDDEHFICTTSSRKHEFMNRRHGKHQVLIDDRPSNIEAWAKAGGIGILHSTPEETLRYIKELVSEEITYIGSDI